MACFGALVYRSTEETLAHDGFVPFACSPNCSSLNLLVPFLQGNLQELVVISGECPFQLFHGLPFFAESALCMESLLRSVHENRGPFNSEHFLSTIVDLCF